MQADYAIELGPNDEVLELPWSAAEHGLQYYDLKQHPELLASVEEAKQIPELGHFLAAINSPSTKLQTAKCDVWASTEINPEEEIFGSKVKFVSYVDLFFNGDQRFSLPEHETFARIGYEQLRHSPDVPAAVDFLIRRCYYHQPSQAPPTRDEGFYITFYLTGYGNNELQARQHWAQALLTTEKILLSAN